MSEESKMKFELTPSVAIIVAGVLIAGSIIFVNHSSSAEDAQQAPVATVNVPAPSASDFIQGSLAAPIVLIEYSDFQCPFCEIIYPTLKKITSESNGKIAWIMREYPLYQIHPQALPAANAAECIADQLGQSGFWKFADTIFGDQAKMSPTYYAQVAGILGANVDTFNSCVSSEKFASKLTKEANDAQTNGANGTPATFVVNTKTGKQCLVPGAQPYANIMAVIAATKRSDTLCL